MAPTDVGITKYVYLTWAQRVWHRIFGFKCICGSTMTWFDDMGVREIWSCPVCGLHAIIHMPNFNPKFLNTKR